MPRIRKASPGPVMSKSKKEDLSQHTLTLSRSRRTIKPNKKYLSDEIFLSTASNKSSRSNSPSDQSDHEPSADEEEEHHSDSDDYEAVAEPKVTRKTVLSTPVRKLQMKSKVTVEKRLNKSAPQKSNLFTKIQKANARPMMNKTGEFKRIPVTPDSPTSKRGRLVKTSPQQTASSIAQKKSPLTIVEREPNSVERRLTRMNKDNSPSGSRASTSSPLSQSTEKRHSVTSSPVAGTKDESKEDLLKKKALETKKKVSEAKKTAVADDFEDFEDALPVFQCTNKSGEEESEPPKPAESSEKEKKIGEVERVNREVNKKPKEYENKNKGATGATAAPVFTLVNINDIMKGIGGQPLDDEKASTDDPDASTATEKPTGKASPSATKAAARNFITSTPMPKGQALLKKRPMSEESGDEITPIKKAKGKAKKQQPARSAKSATETEEDEDEEVTEVDTEEEAPSTTRVLRRTTQQTSSADESKPTPAAKSTRKTINGKQVELKSVKATPAPKSSPKVQKPSPVVTRGKGQQPPPKILNSTLKKHSPPAGTTVSLKAKNDGGTMFTLKTTSPPKATIQQRINNNTIKSPQISKPLLKSPIIRKPMAVSTKVPPKPTPIVRRVTTFETWYVINVPAEKEEKKEAEVDLSLVTLGNNVKTLKLPSCDWSYRITLTRLTDQEVKQRHESNAEIYSGDMSNDANVGEVERNNYEPTNIMFRRLSNNQKLSIQYDRAVIFKNSTFLVNINGKYVTLTGSPPAVSSLDDVVTLLAIVDNLTLSSSCIDQV